MKKILQFLIFITITTNSLIMLSQTCIDENETHTPWTNLPHFSGSDSYIWITDDNDNNATDWIENSFTIDMWVKPTFPYDAPDNVYTMFSSGDLGDGAQAVYIYFDKTDSGWQIRVGDGEGSGTEVDLTYAITYSLYYYEKWKHITVTYDGSGLLKLYIDGNKVIEKDGFDIDYIPGETLTIGNRNNHSYDFRGEMSGFRIWRSCLDEDEVSYVWDKTFNGEETFDSEFTYLNDYLRLNMYTETDNIYSLTPNTGMNEVGISRETDIYHPAKPVNLYNLQESRYCSYIYLDWVDGTSYATNYIYRKLEGSSDSTLVCRTNDSFFKDYQDEENGVMAGKKYVYSIVPIWYNPYENEFYQGKVMQITSALNRYEQVKGLTAIGAQTNCDGVVNLSWNALEIPPEQYIIKCKTEGGDYNTIGYTTTTKFDHTVGDDTLGLQLDYIVSGYGSKCEFYSDNTFATPNSPSVAVPTDLTAEVVDDNIRLSWNFSQTNSSSTSFRVYRSTDGGGTYPFIEDEISIDSVSFLDKTANMCVEYTYKVEAYNSCEVDNSVVSPTVGNITIPVKFDNVFTYNDAGTLKSYFDGSKGYFNQRVDLNWEVNPDKKSDIENIEIYKKVPDGNYSAVTTITNSNTQYYSDTQTDANQIYEYLIRATGHCGVDQVISDTLKTIGFRTSTGLVSGKITFQGGNAVENVEVLVNTDEPITSSSLYFNGQDDLLKTKTENSIIDSLAYKPLTFEAWIKPEASSSGFSKIIFSEDSLRMNFYLEQMQPVFVLNDTIYNGTLTQIVKLTADTSLSADTWYHLAFTFDAENGNVAIFLNGDKIANTYFTPTIPWADINTENQIIQIGGTVVDGQNAAFKGNIDEVRIWQEIRDDDIIKRDYKRILSNDIDNLVAYWHFDENYGINTYDISKDGTDFNKTDLSSNENTFPQWSLETPSFEQLHPAGVTDEMGNYIIKGIRYSGEGGIYNVAPRLGVHEFDPSDINLFISDNTPVHNNINFTDISSFRVTGKVVYKNTTMPVKDCYIKIDGNYIQGENNQLVKTDEHGDYDIQVPIGRHYISVEKLGHIFISQYFPGPSYDSTYYFNDDLYNIDFTDKTLVKLAGRVVGGSVEQAKPVGSIQNPTKNNLGVCEITFTTDNGALLQNNKQDTTIFTDANTGMYEINLCPETYIITTVKVNNTYNFLDGENDIVNMSDCFENIFTVDSVEDENGVIIADTVFTYNKKKDWIRRDAPSLSVYNYNGSKVLGDSLYIINIGDEDQDTIQIASMVGDEAVYKFRNPIFSQERAYAFIATAYETYTNQDNSEIDTVPVIDGDIIIVNNCANDKNQKNIPLDKNGYALYQFFGGLPNITPPFDNKIEISLQVGDENYPWSESPLKAYVSGNLPTGNNFITDGPDKVDYILRDPPGSNSYSYLEQGLEINYTKTTTTSKKWEGSENFIFHLGNKIVTSAGTGFFTVDSDFELENDLTFGFEHSNDWGTEHETNNHFEFNQTFTTSSSPDYVGAMGDLFIGHSSNIFYGISNFIQIINLNDIPTDGIAVDTIMIESEEYAVCKKKGIYLGSSDSTSFVFSQNHIENYLIPNLRMLRNNTYNNNISHYTLVFEDVDDPKFLSNNTDKFYWGNQASDSTHYGPSYLYNNDTQEDMIDSVWYYNEKIISWRNILKNNEKDKLKATIDNNFPSNISFDAGASYEASVQVDTLKVDTEIFEFMISPSFAVSLGFTFNKTGNHFQCEEKYVYTKNRTTSNDTTYVQTVGFVLEDGDQGDYFSVNIRKDKEQGFGPIFKTQGGQSACPYEGSSYTKYYQPGTILNQATMQIEKPNISATENNVFGVPETTPAVFDLVLTNTSDTEDDVWFNLLVDATSNPYGAIVSVDGDPATSEGKAILIPFGQTIHKTLTIEKGQPDYNNIDSIIVILHSQCQFDPTDDIDDIADTVYLSAHFVPACTSVDFNQIYDNWTANVLNNDTIRFQITDYDINSSKFKTISFQTATPGSPRTPRMVFYKDINDYNLADDPKTFINGESVLDYNFDISGLNDGTYELYLKTTCSDGSEYLTPPLAGVIDRVTPKPFGTPEPGDGILSAGEDISLTFNEEVNSGDFYAHNDYIEIRGIPNGTDLVNNESLLHDASIHFDGINQNMLIRNGINMNNTSYTIEFWAKRDASGKECLVSLGSLNDGLWIGFDDNNHFQVKLGSDIITSDNQYLSSDDWVHYAMVYNIGDDQFEKAVNIVIASGATTEEKYLETNSYTNLENLLYIGYCPEDESAFNGNMHEFRIWNIYKTSEDISSEQSKILNGHEQGLYGLWKMNDASGNFAKDLVFGRNAEVNATWQVSRDGKSLNFDGASYSSVPAGEMIFDNQTDFTIEFWFKAQVTGNDMCMFSNGLSDGTIDDNSWNITIKPDNQIEIQNKGISVSFNASEYIDNNWQHFAMTLKRNGYLSIYINGELMKTYYASQFGGFANEKFVLGARWWYSELTNHYDKYFTGNIDEVRIWNTVRQQSQIKEYLNNALNCDEFGLKAYFPFEDVNVANPAISNETLENLTENTYSVCGNMELFGSTAISSESPNIKLQKPIISMPFTYVVNDDKVIITPNMEPADIENTVIDVSVKNVLDIHNNRMSSPATWTAYIDKNQMIWDRQNLSIEKYIDADTTFIVNIQNTGGVSDNFEITNIPDWIEVSPIQGTLSPQETKEVSITIKSILNIGEYVRDINLVSSMGFNERLNLNVKVKAHEPDWAVNPDDFEYTANLIGQLKINDIISTDENDIVATFINGECRGKANVQYLPGGDIFLVFMDVYDNSVSGNEITFKVFDASTGEVYSQVTPSLTFQANSLYGSTSNPVEINATIGIDQDVDLNSGWSWISFNVFNDNFNDLNIALQNMNAVQGDLIKSENEYSQFTSQNTWEGTLTALTYKNMYKIKASKSQTLTMSGAKVIADTVEIPIVEGWNWVGYPAHNQLDITSALSSLNPENNDLIKSQQKFAVYDENLGWIGSLEYLQEGKGYMLSATNSGTLVFLGGNKSSVSDDELSENINLTASNMTLVTEIQLENPENYLLKAYRNGELCGFAAPKKINDKVLYFITINGDLNDEIIFRAESENASFTAIEKFMFNDNQKLGSVQSPYKLTFASSNIEDLTLNFKCDVFPNPFSDKLFININLPYANDIRFELLSPSGMKIFEINEKYYKKGSSKIDLTNKINNLSAGVYMLKIITNNEVQVFQIIKK